MSLPAVSLLLAWLLLGLAEASGAAVVEAVGGVPILRRWQISPAREQDHLHGGACLRRWPGGGAVHPEGASARAQLRRFDRALASGSRHVVATLQPGDCIAFYPLDTRMPFRYYLPAGAPAPRSVLPSISWSRNVPFVEAYFTLSSAS